MCLNLLSDAANRRHTLDFPHPRPPMTIKFNPAPADPASVDAASVDAARARARALAASTDAALRRRPATRAIDARASRRVQHARAVVISRPARARATSSASTRVELCDARHCATPS
jgi:hypothetical protein